MPAGLISGPLPNLDLMRRGAGLARGPNRQNKLLQSAASGTWPMPGATLDLDFVNNRGWVRGRGQGGVMDAITFTRASNGAYVGPDGLLKTASAGTNVSGIAAASVWRQDWADTTRTGAGTQASPYVQPLQATTTANGILIEEQRTNVALWCRDATQTSWTKTNCTVALNQTGIDGVANAATSITATAANATCIQSVAAASASKTGSVYLKRITGTGTVQVTLDGSTWSTVDLSNGLWNRIVLSGTVTNPCVGVLIATSGDAVAMDFAQIEAATFATSPIYTNASTATRAADSVSLQGTNAAGLPLTSGTILLNAVTSRPFGTQGTFLSIFQTNALNIQIYQPSATANTLGVTYPSASNLTMTGFSPFSPCAISFSYGVGSSAFSISGSVPVIGQNNNTLRPNAIWFGLDPNGATYLNGCIGRLVYTPRKLSSAGTQAISSSST